MTGVLVWVLLGAALAAEGEGCRRVLAGGRRYGRGDLAGARRAARAGGFLAAPAALVAGGLSACVPLPAVSVLTISGGFAALLAGLSGKPVPTGWIAGVLWVGAVAAACAGGLS